MARPIGIRSWSLRGWQSRAHNAVVDSYRNKRISFLCESTPGGGKTTFGLTEAHDFLKWRYAERILVVVPSENLKYQWAEAAHFKHLDLNPNLKNSIGCENNEFHGSVITYSQLGMDPLPHKIAINRKRTIVLLDEIHHAGDDLTWGNALNVAFGNAVYLIGLSGTAFRCDNKKIPFVNYKENENGILESKADFRYTYEEAVNDNVCRLVFFPTYDGHVKWKYGENTHSYSMSMPISDDLASQRLRAALDPEKGEFLKFMIKEADDKLNYIRKVEHHSDAAGLVTCIDQEHAKKVANLVCRIAGEMPDVVVSEDSGARNKIKKFSKSNKKWIVSVKMISEGTDIPKLRVGIYATNVKKQLFFNQFVGRFVRVQEHLNLQDAFVFIPKDPTLCSLAKEYESVTEHFVEKKEEKEKTERQMNLFGETEFGVLSSNIKGSEIISMNVSKKLKPSMQTKGNPIIKADVVKDLKHTANGLFRKYAYITKVSYQSIYMKYMRERNAKKIELENETELKSRIEWVESLLRQTN